VTTPLSGQSTTVVEAIGWQLGYIGLPFVLSLVEPLSFYGWLAYLAFNVAGNIFGHANVEITPPSKWLWARSTVAAVFTYHALHHARWTGHYGYASTWMDRLWKTEWNDWLALHTQVWNGKPMASLKERLTETQTPAPAASPSHASP
jgi:sterol desaturase/sphingolipid hydroxylase (fatty acid hydroxylase superfamily)